MEKEEIKADRLTKALLFIYFSVLGWIILLKFGVQFSYMDERKINLIPFANGYYDRMETFLNVLIFIPLGIYGGILFRRRSFKFNLFFYVLICLILEVLQYLLKLGTFDVTDLLTNTSGGIVGYVLFWTYGKLNMNPLKAQKQINVVAAIGTFLFVLLLILLKLNMLPIRYQ
ncbi:MAG: VanZ family protein [Algoriphagus sp.]|uniref:VanZ family protein n=1 Tax=Algoriphagus sp. TaxID=1872435 RepID=UPI00272FE99D|nr:VanZ family protein [Algoriphagus sp.]MDP2043201.1 VanZ family protein [Algoriphagus sp.]MDP3473701.1 VanZ family protein [Algoriphagus sp.]